MIGHSHLCPPAQSFGQSVQVVIRVYVGVISTQPVGQHGGGIADLQYVAHRIIRICEVLHERVVKLVATQVAEPEQTVILINVPSAIAVNHRSLQLELVVSDVPYVFG